MYADSESLLDNPAAVYIYAVECVVLAVLVYIWHYYISICQILEKSQ